MRIAKLAAVIVVLSAAVATADELPKALQLDLGSGVKLDLVLVPAGEFEMGSPEAEKEAFDSERPVHKVKITKPFYMGKLEVTNAQFKRFRPDHSSRHMDGPNQPATFVSWYDADFFCRWLGEKAGKAVALPTEAQWEYACRAGTRTRFYSGDSVRGHMDSADLAKVAWYGANAKGSTKDAGQLPANAFGLHDMHGNAWEWCADWYADDYYKQSPEADPLGPPAGKARILRGGSYYYWVNYYCRSGSRYRFRPDARESVTGFRVAVDPAGKPTKYDAEDVARVQPWPAPRKIAVAPTMTPEEAKIAKQFGGPVVTVVKGSARTIDGKVAAFSEDPKLADPDWAPAKFLVYRHLTGRAAIPEARSVARVMCDDQNLYVAFDCLEPDMDRLTVAGKNRDDDVWQGDTVEIFLDPKHTHDIKGYYHIAINPAGVTMDTKGGDKSWNPKLQVATKLGDGIWRVELAIPFADLGIEAGKIPTVWGLNLTRYRPEFATEKPKQGKLVPHSWPVDFPEKLRAAEDTGWAPTLSDTSHVPSRFGHAIIASGTQPTPPPEKVFEVIAREDFSQGRGKFSAGEVVEGGWMGIGNALKLKEKEVAIWQVPLTQFRDAQLLVAIKAAPTQGVYWHTFSKEYGTNKACARQVTTLTRDRAGLPPTFNYCDGAGRIDFTSAGVLDDYYAGYRKHLLWFSEPTIGHLAFAGPQNYCLAYTRLGELQTQHPHNKLVNPDTDSIPGWFFHAMGEGEVYIAQAVMFRGIDAEPPAKPAGVTVKPDGGVATVSWQPSVDNTIVAWYRVVAGEGKDQQVLAEAAELSVKLPAAKLAGAKQAGQTIRVQAVDFFENASEPSDPAK